MVNNHGDCKSTIPAGCGTPSKLAEFHGLEIGVTNYLLVGMILQEVIWIIPMYFSHEIRPFAPTTPTYMGHG